MMNPYASHASNQNNPVQKHEKRTQKKPKGKGNDGKKQMKIITTVSLLQKHPKKTRTHTA
jgi:hypothetical protein